MAAASPRLATPSLARLVELLNASRELEVAVGQPALGVVTQMLSRIAFA